MRCWAAPKAWRKRMLSWDATSLCVWKRSKSISGSRYSPVIDHRALWNNFLPWRFNWLRRKTHVKEMRCTSALLRIEKFNCDDFSVRKTLSRSRHNSLVNKLRHWICAESKNRFGYLWFFMVKEGLQKLWGRPHHYGCWNPSCFIVHFVKISLIWELTGMISDFLCWEENLWVKQSYGG